jgi:hypothetical protein
VVRQDARLIFSHFRESHRVASGPFRRQRKAADPAEQIKNLEQGR